MKKNEGFENMRQPSWHGLLRKSGGLIISLAALVLFAAAETQAVVWTNSWAVGMGAAGRTNWSSSAIWVGGVVPGSGAGDAVVFSAPNNNATITNDYGNVTVGQMNFLAKPMKNHILQKDSNNYGFTFNNNGNGASLANGANEIAGNVAIFNPITLADNLSIINNASGDGSITLTGSIGESGRSRSLNIYSTFAANGGVILAGANTYSGGTTIGTGGKLTAKTSSSLGAGDIIVANEGTLVLKSATAIDRGAGLIVGSTSVLSLNFTGFCTVSSVSLDGGITWLAAGNYDAAALSLLGTGTYTGTGKLNVTLESAKPNTIGLVGMAGECLLRMRHVFTI